jgi:uncharacterized protein YukE
VTSYWPLSDIDPAPGNPKALTGVASDYKGRATTLESISAQVAAAAAESNGAWIGPASDAFRTTAELATIRFRTSARSFTTAESAITAFASALTDAQRDLKKWADVARSARSSRADAILMLNAMAIDDPGRYRLQQIVSSADYQMANARNGFAYALDLLHMAQRTCIDQLHTVTASRLAGTSASGSIRGAGVGIGGSGIVASVGVDDSGPGIDIGVTVPSKSKASAKDTKKSGRTTKTALDTVEVYRVGRTKTKNTAWDSQFGNDAANETDKSSKAKPTKAKKTTAEVKFAETDFWEHKSSAGAHAEGSGKNGSWSADAGVVASTGGTAKATADKNGVKASVEVSAKAAVEAKAEGEFKAGYVSGGGSVTASIKAEANAHAGVGIGKDGLKAEVGADAFVGGELSTAGHVNAGGVEVGGEAGITYGLGVKFDAGAEISAKKIGLHADIGATLGLGVDLSFNVELHPAELADNAKKLLNNLFW